MNTNQSDINNIKVSHEDIEGHSVSLSAYNRFDIYVTEEKLFLFHASCMCDLDKTKACMETYYSIRSTTPGFFNNRDLSSRRLQDTIENVYVASVYLQEVG